MANKERLSNNYYTVPRELLNMQTIDAVIAQLGWVEDPFWEKRRKWLTRDGLTVTITVHKIELSDLDFVCVRFSFLTGGQHYCMKS